MEGTLILGRQGVEARADLLHNACRLVGVRGLGVDLQELDTIASLDVVGNSLVAGGHPSGHSLFKLVTLSPSTL